MPLRGSLVVADDVGEVLEFGIGACQLIGAFFGKRGTLRDALFQGFGERL